MVKIINIRDRQKEFKVFGYHTYSFVDDRDPEIDKLRTEIQRQRVAYKIVADKAGVSLSTLLGWFNGKTRRPQHATVMAVWGALGFTMVTRRVK